MSQPHHDAPYQHHLMRIPKMFYDIKPRLSPHMVSAGVRQRQFWDTLETAQHTNLDTTVANIWSD